MSQDNIPDAEHVDMSEWIKALCTLNISQIKHAFVPKFITFLQHNLTEVNQTQEPTSSHQLDSSI